ncbi:MAG TPA: isoprenyl transferase [Bdellovibrionales bacterium]|nr:isoprenyl transferase [Bdellovibrionales bacterium]
MNSLNHLAIIMDGNGRWAQKRGHNRFFGHVRGAKVAKSVIEECSQMGLPYLTLFAFSTENWRRPRDEVRFLMKLLSKWLNRETRNLVRQNIRFQIIGDINRIPDFARKQVQKALDETRDCFGMTLTLALSYGGRQEIVSAVKSLAKKVARGELLPEDISDEILAAEMDSAFLPDPDLILRTSGESRISNFMLWQCAYSELQFIDKAWPDFNSSDLQNALATFRSHERRFGKTSAQVIRLHDAKG